ncbi:DUF1800 family protein [Mariniflexile aquimaris]|uniref:DUF1800 family protein n=1 Tax=Mariniflexile aquimaris TaxID=881009 RepID=A0ABW3BVI9_9FLAO
MNTQHLQHLYLRAGFGIGYNKLSKLKSLSKTAVVSHLFSEKDSVLPLEIKLSELKKQYLEHFKNGKLLLDKKSLMALQKMSREKIQELNIAWINRLNNPQSVLTEKMTLFWANVFVCRDTNIFHIQHYNNTLRQHALGDFRQFVKAIAKEASMSKYLNNKQNIKQSPNENFARELMELFTLGIGHYSEHDIKEAARAFTGWTNKLNGDFYVRVRQHDFGEKTFMGKTGNFDGDAVIDIILEQKQCARFICAKIYRYFINPEINTNRLEELTSIFYKNYNIEELMRYIFNSDWFYQEENIGVKIKSPIELLAGMHQIIPFEFQKPRQLLYLQKLMGQILLNPANVAGWKGDKNWIDSNTLMLRLKLPSILLNNAVINLQEKGEFEDSFETYYNAQKNRQSYIKITKSWADFNREYGKLSTNALKELLLVSSIDADTNMFLSNLKITNNQEFCIQLMSIPEYQLC